MRRIVLLLVGIAWPVRAAHAQWHVGVDAGAVSFGAVARDTASDSRHATLGSAVTAGVRLERRIARLRIGLGAAVGGAGFAIADDSVVVGVKHAFRFVELTPEVAVQVITTTTGASLWVEAGPVLGIWMPDVSDTRLRGGVFGGLLVAAPLLSRVTGTFSGRATFMGSPFDAAELVPGFVPGTTPRLSAQVGVRYRL